MSGEELREARERRRWSREYLGGLAGVSSRSIQRYEAGESVPKGGVLSRLREALLSGRTDGQAIDTLAARLTEALAERDAAVARAAELAAVVDEKCAALDRAWAWFESHGVARP